MLPREHRLKAAGDFKRVYSRGRSYVHSLLVLYLLRTGGDLGRLGFSASRKLGGSVERNRARRRLREVCRGLQALRNAGFDGVIVARKGLLTCEYTDIERAVADVFDRALRKRRQEPVEDAPCAGRSSS